MEKFDGVEDAVQVAESEADEGGGQREAAAPTAQAVGALDRRSAPADRARSPTPACDGVPTMLVRSRHEAMHDALVFAPDVHDECTQ